MIKMKIIGYAFWTGALLYLLFAFMVLLSLQINIYIWSVLSLATLFPIVFYLAKCPSGMPLKNVLWTFVLFYFFITLLSIYQHRAFVSLGNSWTDQHEQYLQINRIIQIINTATLMVFKLIIFGQIIKLSKSYSFVWWTCILNFIIALEPIITPVMINVCFRNNDIQYIIAISLIHNIGFALLYLSIGLFFMPKSD